MRIADVMVSIFAVLGILSIVGLLVLIVAISEGYSIECRNARRYPVRSGGAIQVVVCNIYTN